MALEPFRTAWKQRQIGEEQRTTIARVGAKKAAGGGGPFEPHFQAPLPPPLHSSTLRLFPDPTELKHTSQAEVSHRSQTMPRLTSPPSPAICRSAAVNPSPIALRPQASQCSSLHPSTRPLPPSVQKEPANQ